MSVVLNLYRWGAVLLVVTGVSGDGIAMAMGSSSVGASAQPAAIGASKDASRVKQQRPNGWKGDARAAMVEETGGVVVVVGRTP